MKKASYLFANEQFSVKIKENPHPILNVPGTGSARWDPYIGRWVVGKRTYDRTYI